MDFKSCFIAVFFFLISGCENEAPETLEERGEVFEYPPDGYEYLSVAKERIRLSSIFGPVILAVADKVTVWSVVDMPLSVCFYDDGTTTSKKTRSRIRDIIQKWTSNSNALSFDLNANATPDSCDGNDYDIRISFNGHSAWSLHGRESALREFAGRPSMFLGNFHRSPPKDSEFERLVLHEFGHALGLYHEHQNPSQSCENEYDWDVLESHLSGPPYGLSKEKIKSNFSQRAYVEPQFTAFDKESIMLYTFEPKYYLLEEASSCFHKKNSIPSSQDMKFIANILPVPGAPNDASLDDMYKVRPSNPMDSAKNEFSDVLKELSIFASKPGVPEEDKAYILDYVMKFKR